MLKTGKMKSLYFCIIILVVSVCFASAKGLTVSGQSILEGHSQESEISLILKSSYNNETEKDILTIETLGGGEDYQYQYWIKENIHIDDINPADTRSAWVLLKPYSTLPIIFSTEDKESYIDEDGNYTLIARVKDNNGVLVREIFRTFTSSEIGKPIINAVMLNGEYYIGEDIFLQGESFTVKVLGNYTDMQYSLLVNEATLSAEFTEGQATVSMSDLQLGKQELTIQATRAGKVIQQRINIEVIAKYIANDIPVIEYLKDTRLNDEGLVQYVLGLTYADGTPISSLTGISHSLNIEGKRILSKTDSFNEETGVYEIIFEKDYHNKYGIYYVSSQVGRDTTGRYDDMYILYSKAYTRTATLSLSAKSESDEQIKQTYELNEMITFTADGSVVGADNIKYGFFREDAIGWVMIRDYDSSPTFSWTPLKAGYYNIQVRIKDENAGSYEKNVSKTYVITDPDKSFIDGNIGISVFDYVTRQPITGNLIAGNPYIFSVDYDNTLIENEDLLFRFTLTNKNIGLKYMTRTLPKSYFMYIPEKESDFIITVRMMQSSSFGFKELSFEKAYTATNEYFNVYNEELFASDKDIIIDEFNSTSASYKKILGYHITDELGNTNQVNSAELKLISGEYTIQIIAETNKGNIITSNAFSAYFVKDPDAVFLLTKNHINNISVAENATFKHLEGEVAGRKNAFEYKIKTAGNQWDTRLEFNLDQLKNNGDYTHIYIDFYNLTANNYLNWSGDLNYYMPWASGDWGELYLDGVAMDIVPHQAINEWCTLKLNIDSFLTENGKLSNFYIGFYHNVVVDSTMYISNIRFEREIYKSIKNDIIYSTDGVDFTSWLNSKLPVLENVKVVDANNIITNFNANFDKLVLPEGVYNITLSAMLNGVIEVSPEVRIIVANDTESIFAYGEDQFSRISIGTDDVSLSFEENKIAGRSGVYKYSIKMWRDSWWYKRLDFHVNYFPSDLSKYDALYIDFYNVSNKSIGWRVNGELNLANAPSGDWGEVQTITGGSAGVGTGQTYETNSKSWYTLKLNLSELVDANGKIPALEMYLDPALSIAGDTVYFSNIRFK